MGGSVGGIVGSMVGCGVFVAGGGSSVGVCVMVGTRVGTLGTFNLCPARILSLVRQLANFNWSTVTPNARPIR